MFDHNWLVSKNLEWDGHGLLGGTVLAFTGETEENKWEASSHGLLGCEAM